MKKLIDKIVGFFNEVIEQVKKVTWPNRKEVMGSTVVVITFILIIAIFTGLIDFVLSIVLARLIQ
jgi:preprotein translocase subunit SecE